MNVFGVLVAVSLALSLDGWVTLIRVDMHDRYVPDGANGPTQTVYMELFSMEFR